MCCHSGHQSEKCNHNKHWVLEIFHNKHWLALGVAKNTTHCGLNPNRHFWGFFISISYLRLIITVTMWRRVTIPGDSVVTATEIFEKIFYLYNLLSKLVWNQKLISEIIVTHRKTAFNFNLMFTKRCSLYIKPIQSDDFRMCLKSAEKKSV